MNEIEERALTVGHLKALAKDQIFIRGCVDEEESSYDLSYTGERITTMSACVFTDDPNLLCEVKYKLSEPISRPSQLDNSVQPVFWVWPVEYFRSVEYDSRSESRYQAFTDRKPVVIWHNQRNRCLSPSDTILLQHYARMQTGLAPYMRQGQHGKNDQMILELFFHRLSCFITTQNRRRREVDGI